MTSLNPSAFALLGLIRMIGRAVTWRGWRPRRARLRHCIGDRSSNRRCQKHVLAFARKPARVRATLRGEIPRPE